MGMFPYPSSDGTSSAVSFFAGSPALFRANSNHFLVFLLKFFSKSIFIILNSIRREVN